MLSVRCYRVRMDTLVSRLNDLMREHGDDQTSLARKIGCTPAAINQILTGRTQRSRLLPEIADLYDVALPFLLGRSNDRGAQLRTEDRMTGEARRLVNLFQQLDRQDRALVMSVIERVAGVSRERVKDTGVPVSSPQTLHDRQLGYRTG